MAATFGVDVAVGGFASSLVAAGSVVVVFGGSDGVAVVFNGADGVAVVFDGPDGVAAVFDEAVVVVVVLSAIAVLGSTGERASVLPRAGRPHLPLAMSRRASSTSVSVQSDTCVPGQRRKGRHISFAIHPRQPAAPTFTVVRIQGDNV